MSSTPRRFAIGYLFLFVLAASSIGAASAETARYIVTLSTPAADVERTAADLAKEHDGRVLAVWKHAARGFWVELTPANASRLATHKLVATVEQDVPMSFSGSGSQQTGPTVPDPLWHLTRISHRAIQDGTAGKGDFNYTYPHDGAGVRVYLIDSGIQKAHAEFSGRNVSDNERVTEHLNTPAVQARLNDGNVENVPIRPEPNSNPNDLNPCRRTLTPQDNAVHGTRVGSLVVGNTVGVARGAHLIPVIASVCQPPSTTVITEISMTAALLISALDWIAQDKQKFENVNVPAVVSMSSYLRSDIQCESGRSKDCVMAPELAAVEKAINDVIDLGVPVIASANNYNRDACGTIPTRFSRRGGRPNARVISVSATNANDERWLGTTVAQEPYKMIGNPKEGDGSNFGQCVDIFAPGANVQHAGLIGTLQTANGTSFAAPIVAGLVARLLSEDPELFTMAPRSSTADRVWQRLSVNATELDPDLKKLGDGSPNLLAYLGGVTFLEQPQSVSVRPGTSVTFRVKVHGTGVVYEWYQGEPGVTASSVAIAGATAETLTVTAPSDPGKTTYWCRVKRGSTYFADSRGATITVIAELPETVPQCPTPVFVKQPASSWSVIGQPNAETPSTHEAIVKTFGKTYTYRVMERKRFSNGTWTDVEVPQSTNQVTSAGTESVSIMITLPGRPAMQQDWKTGQEPPHRYPGVFWLELTPAEPGSGCKTVSDTFQVRPCGAVDFFTLTALNFAGASEILMRDAEDIRLDLQWGARVRWYIGNPRMPLRVELDDKDPHHPERAVTLHVVEINPPFAGTYWGSVSNECQEALVSREIPGDIGTNAPFLSCTWHIESRFDALITDTTTAYLVVPTGPQAVPDATQSIDLRTVLNAANNHSAIPPGATLTWTGAQGTKTSRRIERADIEAVRTGPGPRQIVVSATDRGDGCTKTHTFKFCFDLIGKGPGDAGYLAAATIENKTYPFSNGGQLEVQAQAGLSYEWKHNGAVIGTGPTLALSVVPVTDTTTVQVTARETGGGISCPAKSITFKIHASNCSDFFIQAGRCQLVATPQVSVRPGARIRLNSYVTDVDGVEITNATFKWFAFDGTNRIQPPFHEGTGAAGAETGLYQVTSNVKEIHLDVTRGNCTSTKVIPVRFYGTFNDYTPPCGRYRPMRHRLGAEPEPVSLLSYTEAEVVTLGVEIERAGYAYEWYRRSGDVETSIGTGTTITLQMDEPATYWYVESNAMELVASDEVEARPLDENASAGASVVPSVQSVAAGNYATITAELDASKRRPYDVLKYEWRRGSLYDDTKPILSTAKTVSLTNLLDDDTFWCRIEQKVDDVLVATYDTPFASVFIRCTTTVHGLMNAHPHFIAAGETSMIVPSVHGKLPYLDWWTLGEDGVTRTPYGSSELRPINVRPTDPKITIGATATDACGTVGTIDPTTVFVCVPSVTEHPRASTVIAGGTSTTLTAAATPAIPGQVITVKWYDQSDSNHVNPLHIGSSFTTPEIPAGTTRSYVAAFIVDCTDSQTYLHESATAVVEACVKPAIADTPAVAWSTNPGSAVEIAVSATGTDLSYQWYRGEPGDDSNPVPNGNGYSVTVYPTTMTTYWCRVKSRGVCIEDTDPIVVRVCSTPSITLQPQSKRIFKNTATTLSVVVDPSTNTETISYQWQQRIGGGVWTTIAGAEASTLTTPVFSDALQEVSYRVLIDAGVCSTISNVATVNVCTYPAVVPVQERKVRYNESVFLSLPSMSPVETKTITWYRGESGNSSQPMRTGVGTDLLNETGPITGTSYFWAEFEHLGCVSRTETYVVRACIPEITAQPAGSMVPSGTPATLSVGTKPIAGLTYQWYIGAPSSTANPVPNGNAATIQVSPLSSTTYWCRVTSPCGNTVDSQSVTVNTCTGAEISNIFVTPSQSVPNGTTVELRINASGVNKTYQWYQGAKGVISNPVTNGTSDILMRNITAATSYWCRVTTDGVCQKDSDAVSITVCTNPTITTEPASPYLFPGTTSTTLSVVASPLPVTYQWYTGTTGEVGSPINGAISSSVTVQPAGTTSYWVRVSNGGCKDDSITATVTKCVLPQQVDARQPSTNVAYNETLTLSLPNMTPSVDKNVTWYRGAVGVKTTEVASGVNASYTATHLQSGTYWAEFTHNGCVSRTTAYVVTVCKPTINTQPQNRLIESGQTAQLTVTASGESLAYQWYTGPSGNTASPVPNATSFTLNVSPTSDTTYWVRVSGCTVADSAAATVTVCVTPSISGLTKGSDGRSGDPAWVTVAASGPNLSYQWFKGTSGDVTTPVPGAISATLNFTLSTTAYYWVRVTSTCTGGSTRSVDSAAVLYSVFPTISKSPSNTAIPSSGRTLLTVTAAGGLLTYQWYETTGYTSTPINGATSFKYLTLPATTTKKYWVKVTSGALSINSSVAQVDICGGPTIESFTSSGSVDDFTFTVNVADQHEDLVTYHWYSGTLGVPSESVDRGEGIYKRTFLNITPLPATFWVRVHWSDGSCYQDTLGKTVP